MSMKRKYSLLTFSFNIRTIEAFCYEYFFQQKHLSRNVIKSRHNFIQYIDIYYVTFLLVLQFIFFYIFI